MYVRRRRTGAASTTSVRCTSGVSSTYSVRITRRAIATSKGRRRYVPGRGQRHAPSWGRLGAMAKLPTTFVRIHGHEVAYKAAGEGPALVLVHGIAGSSATWSR